MKQGQAYIFVATIAATITTVGGLMLDLRNRERIAGVAMDAFLTDSEENGGMISPGRNSKALTVYYRCADKQEQSMWMLARDEAEAAAIILDLYGCPATRFVEQKDYWSKKQ